MFCEYNDFRDKEKLHKMMKKKQLYNELSQIETNSAM